MTIFMQCEFLRYENDLFSVYRHSPFRSSNVKSKEEIDQQTLTKVRVYTCMTNILVEILHTYMYYNKGH